MKHRQRCISPHTFLDWQGQSTTTTTPSCGSTARPSIRFTDFDTTRLRTFEKTASKYVRTLNALMWANAKGLGQYGERCIKVPVMEGQL